MVPGAYIPTCPHSLHITALRLEDPSLFRQKLNKCFISTLNVSICCDEYLTTVQALTNYVIMARNSVDLFNLNIENK